MTALDHSLRRLGSDFLAILLGGAKTVFHFVISNTLSAALVGALLAVRFAGGGYGFYFLGISLGLLIGLACSYVSLRAVRAAGPRHVRLLFAGTVIWLFASAFLGYGIVRLALDAII